VTPSLRISPNGFCQATPFYADSLYPYEISEYKWQLPAPKPAFPTPSFLFVCLQCAYIANLNRLCKQIAEKGRAE